MKIWEVATMVMLSVVVSALVTASALVLLNQPKINNVGVNTAYPNGANSNSGYVSYPTPYPTTNLQTSIPSPTPNVSYPQTTLRPVIPQPTPSQYGNQTWGFSPPTTLSIGNATAIAQNYVIRLYNPDLAVKQVEEYSQNFYVQVYERSTGIGAFELLVDKYTGNVYPETGPSSAWNAKYGTGGSVGYGSLSGFGNGFGPGMEGRMMGGWGPFSGTWGPFSGTVNSAMPISMAQASASAQQYLNTYVPGTTLGYIMPFYGYYSVQVLQSGRSYGVLSINGYTGQVWFHNWHGAFVQ